MSRNATVPAGRIRIGISSCLLGERVRFDGGHKRDGFLILKVYDEHGTPAKSGRARPEL